MRRSDALLKGINRAPARAMLKATGLKDADLEKPLIAVANTWTDATPCNVHLRDLAVHVKEGIRAAGGTPIEFNTVVVSDGISMGTEGMRASLVSREVIADSIELAVRGALCDGVIALSGCDKTIPGTMMALARLDVPGLMLYGGSIMPGNFRGKEVTIQEVFEAVGACAAGRITESELRALEDVACPGAGACGGQFTANTMAIASEFLGIAALGSGSVPANDPAKAAVARATGERVMALVRAQLRPRDIVTRTALDNAIVAVAATGGSTNAVLHLLAIAREADVPLDLANFDRASVRVPVIADLKPSGRFVATDLHAAGGSALVAQRLIDSGHVDGTIQTVTGRTLEAEAADAQETPG
ncbi:MAG TPA: dihydroxy-acid dehydratase, partial [Polyangia bacterium]|nr:dihydroxy-acid dehydratase [Polyangia bacterium]